MKSFKNPFHNAPKSQGELQSEKVKLDILNDIYQTIDDREGQEYVHTQREELSNEEKAQLKAEETARLKADEKANQKKQNSQQSSSYSFQYKPTPAVPKQREGLISNEPKTGRKLLFIPVMVIVVLAGYWLYSPLLGDNIFTPSASSSDNDKGTADTGNINSSVSKPSESQETYTNSINSYNTTSLSDGDTFNKDELKGKPGSIELKDIESAYLTMDSIVTYEFTREGNPIRYISFYSLKNSGEISSTIEVLNGRSNLVNSDPGGLVYKYINIWVGKSGFDSEANIRDSKINFQVDTAWLEDKGVSPVEIRLQRYNGNSWETLPTILVSNSADYLFFESETPSFSAFVITAG